jgi:hypothetical protein
MDWELRMRSDAATKQKSWMPVVLRLAGGYNVLWGAVAVLFPGSMMNWLRVPADPIALAFWQCLGMVIGVYGIGYWIAAKDPVRHWLIVFVGLLGKVFGPIGFAWSVWQGTLPASLGWNLLTNDLIWWVPFGAILWHAYCQESRAAPITAAT